MPTLVLAAAICPPGVEAALFAALMSVFNASSAASSALGGGLAALLGVTAENFDHLPQLVAICSLSSLVALPFLSLLDDVAGEGGGKNQELEPAPAAEEAEDESARAGGGGGGGKTS